MTRRRAMIYTLGCRLNHAESGIIAERLSEAGYTLVSPEEPADVCIINTCTVTREADAKSRKMIRAFVRKHPEAFVAVVGCYAELAAEVIAGIPGVDLVLGTQDKLQVIEYIAENKNIAPVVARRKIDAADFTIALCNADGSARGLAHRANLKIQDGCDQWCSYCIVPAARGPARSRDFDNLMEEAAALARRGTKEIVLTGVNVGAYANKGRTLLDVIDGISALEGIRRVRCGSIELLLAVPEGLLERMADPDHALVPFLHIPLQSGSDRIIERMRRNYTAKAFLDFTRSAVARVPELCVGVDVLVGFPGESEADFDETCRLLQETPISYAHVFKYSDRKGAAAALMEGKVDANTLHARSERAREISLRKRHAFHERHLGATVEVLFEEKAEGYWWGYTGNYIQVAACSDECLENTLRYVVLSSDRGEHMQGQLAEDNWSFEKG